MRHSYLASPYTNPDNSADRLYCEQRFAEACHASARLMQRGLVIFSPIAHSHPIADYLPADLRADHAFWLRQDFAMLATAERLIVLKLYQWERSYGVGKEIDFAHERHIPIAYLDPATL